MICQAGFLEIIDEKGILGSIGNILKLSSISQAGAELTAWKEFRLYTKFLISPPLLTGKASGQSKGGEVYCGLRGAYIPNLDSLYYRVFCFGSRLELSLPGQGKIKARLKQD